MVCILLRLLLMWGDLLADWTSENMTKTKVNPEFFFAQTPCRMLLGSFSLPAPYALPFLCFCASPYITHR